jgi:hypothetical protein
MIQRPSGLLVPTDYAKPTNGESSDYVHKLLEQETIGYKPSLPVIGMFGTDGLPLMWLRQDLELMLTHPVVRQALGYFKGGIAGAEFWGGPNPDAADGTPEADKGLPICPENDQVGRFIKEQCERFWDRGVPHIQSGYEYGWVGCENVYGEDDGVFKWDSLYHFSPRDTYLLTQDFKPVGIRVKGVQGGSKPLDLWMAGDAIPAKAMWYAHNPRYNTYYGQSQMVGAWRPWRRAAWKNGAESVLDMAAHRGGVGWIVGRYPPDDLQGPNPGAPNTTLDSQGNPRRFARDIMRQIIEQAKAGAGVGLPNTLDAQGNYKYNLEILQGLADKLESMTGYLDHLYDQITQGIGVPPELLEASESGSGYSGRRIPLEAFLANQQQIADAILKLFVDQVMRPLVRMNFGWGIKFNVMVKSLIKTRTKQAQGEGQKQPGQGAPQQGMQSPMQRMEPTQRMDNPNQAMFSHQRLITDAIRDKARKILRAA